MVDRVLIEIRKKRKELNYSQEYIASLLNISQSSYNKIENGTTELTVNTLYDIAQILEFDIDELINLKKRN